MNTDDYRLSRISEVGHQLLDIVEKRGITKELLSSDLETQWLVTTPLFNIGEQVNCLSDSLIQANSDIPWSQIAGLRHRLVHHYEGTNWDVIASVLFDELAAFLDQVESICAVSCSSQSEDEQ
ncbi:MAG: DUF86 domain-containing protein [Eggerthellaceae bacterium]|nr:DUF86 domain-containing protein [Eggerthellaceae bacterium]